MLSTTRTAIPLLALAVALLLPGTARAEEGPPGMTWADGLEKAFELAKAQDKPVMICINAKRVDRGRREPAALELRQYTYRDKKVIELSKKFICAFLTAEGSAKDFGELRYRYEIDGNIVSPQHIFAYPDGRLIYRKEFWPYGTGKGAVEALLKLMNDALKKDDARRGRQGVDESGRPTTPGADAGKQPEGDADGAIRPDEPVVRDAPDDPEAREAWIVEQLGLLTRADDAVRRAALTALMDADREGDIVLRLIALLPDHKKQPIIQAEIIRALGRPGLEIAAEPLGKYLGHREDTVRANTAVTLEYIGSKASVADLKKRAAKEKVVMIANHMYRALGRCGVGDSRVRAFLVKRIEAGKSEESSYGPIIGLAYFEKDPKAAKAVQALLRKWGVPGGRGGWRGGLRRALLTWCLTEVGFANEKSAKFLSEEMLPAIPVGRWTSRITDFYEAAASVCAGDESRKDEIDESVRGSINRYNRDGDNPLMDEARRNRDEPEFEPKGEWGGGRSS